MQRLEWDEGLVTGDALVDRQHRGIFALVQELADIVEAGGDRQRTADVLYDLMRYVCTHFADEEALMLRIGYPRLEEQRRTHDQFRAEAQQMVAGFLADQGLTSQTLLKQVVDWVNDHVVTDDRHLAEFIRGEAKSA